MKKKYLLLIISMTMSISLSYGIETAKLDSVWIRPVKEDTITNEKDHGKVYRLFKGSLVQVKGEKNGDIVIGKDTLTTDASAYTDYKKKRKVAVADIAKRYQLKDNIANINDSILFFAFANLEGKEKLHLFINSDKKEQQVLCFGANDTVLISDLGVTSDKLEKIILVSENALASYIPFKDIPSVEINEYDVDEVTEESESSMSTSIIILIVVLIILSAFVAVVFLYIRLNRRNESYGKSDSTKKYLKQIDSAKREFDKRRHKINGFVLCNDSSFKGRQKDKYKNTIENVSQSMNDLHTILTEAISVISDAQFYTCISKMQEVNMNLKKLSKIKNTDSLDRYLTLLDSERKNLNELIASLKDIIEKNRDLQSLPDDTLNINHIPQGKVDVIAPSQNEEIMIPDLNNVPEDVKNYVEYLRRITENVQKDSQKVLHEKDTQYTLLHNELQTEQSKSASLQVQLDSSKKKLEEEKLNRDMIIKKKVQEIIDECNSKVRKTEATAIKKVEAANERANKAEEKSRSISDELNARFDVERKAMEAKQKKLANDLELNGVELKNTKQTLQKTEINLDQANRQIQNLMVETESFHKHLSGAVESISYCEAIMKLIVLANKIQDSASALLQSDMEDKYFIYKPIALYFAKLNTIKLQNFYTDVEMVSKTGFVIKGTPLASYDAKLSKDELASMTRNYFFTNYLKTFIDAIVVLNESLAGLPYLVVDAKDSEVSVFIQYRQHIEDTIQKLGINVLTVKVYDSVGVNTDLLATEVDADIEKHGAILEIENCKVNLIGGAPNTERIRVKIQK